MKTKMTSLERVLTTLGHQEPDRVPLFLLLTHHGAKELGMSIQEYFSKAENVVKGQLLMQKKFRNDCLIGFYYVALETEAWGGDVIYYDDGPVNAGSPIIKNNSDIEQLQAPVIEDSPCLTKVLKTISMLKEQSNDVPVLGVVVSPFSLPVVQMGFPNYIELMYEQPDLFEQLMAVNEQFCIRWANAQLAAGATAIAYVDPVSSSTVVSQQQYIKTGFEIAKRVLAQIEGPTVTNLASGRAFPNIELFSQTGTIGLFSTVLEDLVEMKEACRGKLTLIGDLNGIEMRRWTPEMAEQKVKEAIQKAAVGGGFILSDNHGEIPWQVSDDILLAISDAVHKWGKYPIEISKNA